MATTAADLIAQGPAPDQRWRRTLRGSDAGLPETVVGRESPGWSVPWDDRISRRHFRISSQADGWLVERLPGVRNPIFHRGHPLDSFPVQRGDHWVVGRTTFILADAAPEVEQRGEDTGAEWVLDTDRLRHRSVREPAQHIAALSRMPDLFAGTASDEEFLGRLTTHLLLAIDPAQVVAIVAMVGDVGDDRSAPLRQSPKILQWDNRAGLLNLPGPSARLLQQASSKQASVLHTWPATEESAYTRRAGIDWAFCVPVLGQTASRSTGHGAGRERWPGADWLIYVAGSTPRMGEPMIGVAGPVDELLLGDELKFTEVVAGMVANVMRLRAMERRQAALRSYLPPLVMDSIDCGQDDRMLRPREVHVTTMFCDLRGFSQQTEAAAGQLIEHLERVSRAMTRITDQILACQGVIGDFHGDAVMGFWGWPFPQEDGPGRAVLAALAIDRAMSDAIRPRAEYPEAGFQVAIGIAHGPAVAGRIGSQDQVKVTAMGPSVNLASRLEGLSKRLGVPILLDEATAGWVNTHLSPVQARVRRIARVLPAGFTRPEMVSQLLPPCGSTGGLAEAEIHQFESAVDAWMAGRWEVARKVFDGLAISDPVARWLRGHFLPGDGAVPTDWKGVLILESP